MTALQLATCITLLVLHACRVHSAASTDLDDASGRPRPQFWWKELHVAGRPSRVWEHRHVAAEARAAWPALQGAAFLPFGPAPHLFVRYSAYRYSMNKFFVLGLSAETLLKSYKKEVFEACLWLPAKTSHAVDKGAGNLMGSSDTLIGAVRTRLAQGTHNHIYDTLVVECSFAEPVNAGSHGGYLFLQPKPPPEEVLNVAPLEAVTHPMLVFHEDQNVNMTMFASRPVVEQNEPFHVVEYGHCGPPIHGSVLPQQVGEWYKYHYELLERNVHFYVYDVGGMNSEMEEMFEEYKFKGGLEVIDARKHSEYDTFYFAQILLLNDCLHRARYVARWVFNFDVDEYLVVPPPQTIKSILKRAQKMHTVTFGTVLYTVRHCLENRSLHSWKVEHMVYREEKPVCIHNKEKYSDHEFGCDGTDGRRKWMMNPWMVALTKVHEPHRHHILNMTFRDSLMAVNARKAWIGHYRRITLPPATIHCEAASYNSSLSQFSDVSKYGLERREVKYMFDSTIKRTAERMRKKEGVVAVE